ncbi:MAG TPA: TIGR03618 family F420-dependent PPOX class oxidoreductase [Pseudonocardiaceae bacterium]|jgi:PPOX class probable F420-dependent enzyme|nr:TIGR03618 family F420-dependent PPOX class oxidoreductase [Pseudonocardiaceae bacterium]
MDLPDDLIAALTGPSACFLATLMPDGSPQLTQTWVDTDGKHILINSVDGHQKVRNARRDPRVAINVVDPPAYYAIRGRVVDITTDGAAEHIEKLSQRYNGGPYPWYGGRDQVRVLLTIEADRIREPRRRR